MRKKIREPSNVVKVWSHVMLILPNVTIKLLNVRKKKNKDATKCEKSIRVFWSFFMFQGIFGHILDFRVISVILLCSKGILIIF